LIDIPLEKILKSFNVMKFIPSTYGDTLTLSRKIDVSVRDSMIYKENVRLELPEFIGSYPNRKHVYVNECEIVHYNVGGHFASHTDRDRSNSKYRNTGALLIIPPLSVYNHTGGDLVIHKSNINNGFHPKYPNFVDIPELTIKADEKLYTLVYIPLAVEHSVTTVTSGTRRIIKYSVFVDEESCDRLGNYTGGRSD